MFAEKSTDGVLGRERATSGTGSEGLTLLLPGAIAILEGLEDNFRARRRQPFEEMFVDWMRRRELGR